MIVMCALGSGPARVAGVVAGLILALLGVVLGVAGGVVKMLGGVSGTAFGMCTGMPGAGGKGADALTPWLHERLQSMAMPWTTQEYFFEPAEMRQLFPEDIVKWMEEHPPAAPPDGKPAARQIGQPFADPEVARGAAMTDPPPH